MSTNVGIPKISFNQTFDDLNSNIYLNVLFSGLIEIRYLWQPIKAIILHGYLLCAVTS